MKFFKKTGKGAQPEPSDNPYIAARQEWMERYGSYVARASQWRMAALLQSVSLIICLAALVVLLNQSQVIAYFVSVDKVGKTAVVKADSVPSTPPEIVQNAIAESITAWRTVTPDYHLQGEMVKKLSAYVAGSAKGVIKSWYEQNNPAVTAENGRMIHVEITQAPLPVSKTSYRVEWRETIRNHAGVVIESGNYVATVTIQIQKPTSEKMLLANPGGVFITGLAFSKTFAANTPNAE